MDMRPYLQSVPMEELVGNMGAWGGAVAGRGQWPGLLEAGFGMLAAAEALRCQLL